MKKEKEGMILCFQNVFPTKWSLVNVQQKENTGKGNEKKLGGEKRKGKSWVAMHSSTLGSVASLFFQLSWIIWETPGFRPYLPVSRLASDIF